MSALLNEIAAAEFLGVSPRTLQGWRLRGGGPAYHKIGKMRVGYDMSDLEAFKQAGRRTSTSGPSHTAAAS